MCDIGRRIGGSTPPSLSWMVPLVEDMLHDTRTRLTKAVVIGPGRAVLFYGRCPMGEGLSTDEARDATFLITGAGMWVGKSAYLATDPMTIQEGRQAIAQAITDCRVKARGPGCPHVNLLAQQPFRFDPLRGFPMKDASGDGGSDHQPSPHGPLQGQECNRHWRDQRPPSPQFPHLPQIMGLRATGVHYQQLPQCCLGLTGQMDPNVLDKGGGTMRTEFTWR